MAAPLFMAVLWSDANHIEELLKLGANPDGHAGKFADGVMARELKVSTPRQLAITMKKDSIVERFREPMVRNQCYEYIEENLQMHETSNVINSL